MYRACGGHPQDKYISPWSTGILKVYTETLTEFNHVYHPDGLNNTLLSKGVAFEQLWL